jgi:hypothetical protein
MAHSTCDLEMGMGRLVTLSHEACSEPLQIFSAKYSCSDFFIPSRDELRKWRRMRFERSQFSHGPIDLKSFLLTDLVYE